MTIANFSLWKASSWGGPHLRSGHPGALSVIPQSSSKGPAISWNCLMKRP